jgi:hypothetical protein
MFASFERRFGSREVPIVRSRYADEIHSHVEQLPNGVGFDKALKAADVTFGTCSISFGPATGAAGDRSEIDFTYAEPSIVQALTKRVLEERTVSLVENHSHADHTASQALAVS